MTAQGHRVHTPDLASARSRGRYPSLKDYAALICEAVETLGDKPILVGHSMGGLVVSQAAEWLYSKVCGIVYVSGFLLRNRESLVSYIRDNRSLGVDDLVIKHMKLDADGRLARFPEGKARDIFYNTSGIAAATAAAAQLRPQPTAVYSSPLELSNERFGAVPRFYIETLQDNAVSPIYQRHMLSVTPCKTYHLDTDHSPFISAPELLTASILDAAMHAEDQGRAL